MQPYPSGANAPAPAGPDLPPPVKMAVRLMWIGAALSAISAVVAAATVSSLRDAIVKVHPTYSATQIHSLLVLKPVRPKILAMSGSPTVWSLPTKLVELLKGVRSYTPFASVRALLAASAATGNCFKFSATLAFNI